MQDVSTLMDSLHGIRTLVDFENEQLWEVFDKVISPRLIEVVNLEQLTEIAKVAFEMELPYQTFWAGMVNVLLISHQEFSIAGDKSSLIDFMYYIVRSLSQALEQTGEDMTLQDLMELDPEMLPSKLASNQNLVKRA